jgi:hypothetical protein
LVTAPMLITATNLASRFCSLTMQSADTKARFYRGIDFKQGVENDSGGSILTDSMFNTSIQNLSNAFWGRSPSSDETSIITNAKSEFLSAYSVAERRNQDSSTKLMLFTCTAMLVSFDSISF